MSTAGGFELKGDWKKDVRKLRRLVLEKTKVIFEIGDYLGSMKAKDGASYMQLVAEASGLDPSVTRQYIWIAEKFPPQHEVRSLRLSFSHVRVLAAVEDPVAWGSRCVKEGWGVRELQHALYGEHSSEPVVAGQMIYSGPPLEELKSPQAFTSLLPHCAYCGGEFGLEELPRFYYVEGSVRERFHLRCVVIRVMHEYETRVEVPRQKDAVAR